jgi:acyl dehydratase
MVDPAALGHIAEPFEMDLERGKVREFARATFSANPSYLDGDAPPVPATFLTTMGFWAGPGADAWAAVRMDPSRGRHAEQEFSFSGPPPRSGTRLVGRSRVAEIYTKPGRRGGDLTFAVMVTEFRDRDGELVASARLTGVETDTIDTTAPAAAPAAPSVAPAARAAPMLGPAAPVSGPVPLVIGPLTRTDLVRYQGASGDFYAIHHDEPFARAAGLPAPLSLGMLQAGMLATWATDWLGAEAVRSVRFRFAEQVYPGDTVTCGGRAVRSYHGEDGRPRADLELVCTTQTGAVAVRGWATFATSGLLPVDDVEETR